MEVGLAVAGRCRATRTQSPAAVAPGGFATVVIAHASAARVVIGTAFFECAFFACTFLTCTFFKDALFTEALVGSDFLKPEVGLAVITSATQKRTRSPTLTRTGNTIC
jgi:hypothetical protein